MVGANSQVKTRSTDEAPLAWQRGGAGCCVVVCAGAEAAPGPHDHRKSGAPCVPGTKRSEPTPWPPPFPLPSPFPLAPRGDGGRDRSGSSLRPARKGCSAPDPDIPPPAPLPPAPMRLGMLPKTLTAPASTTARSSGEKLAFGTAATAVLTRLTKSTGRTSLAWKTSASGESSAISGCRGRGKYCAAAPGSRQREKTSEGSGAPASAAAGIW